MDVTLVSAIIAGVSAAGAIGSTVAAFVSMRTGVKIARMQMRATTVSASRQRWIDAVRDEVSAFISEGSHIMYIRGTERDAIEEERRLGEVFKSLRFHVAKLDLLLNPREKDHQELLNELNNVMRHDILIPDNIPKIIAQTQTILKREWERVKASE